jgi:hypothetical protein
VYIDTTFFLIHLSVLGHLVCFHSLANVNNATKNNKHGCAGAFFYNLSHITVSTSLGVVVPDYVADLCLVPEWA